MSLVAFIHRSKFLWETQRESERKTNKQMNDNRRSQSVCMCVCVCRVTKFQPKKDVHVRHDEWKYFPLLVCSQQTFYSIYRGMSLCIKILYILCFCMWCVRRYQEHGTIWRKFGKKLYIKSSYVEVHIYLIFYTLKRFFFISSSVFSNPSVDSSNRFNRI